MSWSAAEVMALAQKAARGAGAPPAQAARFGQAAALHLMAGRDAGLLKAALLALPEGPVITFPLAIDRCLTSDQAGAPADLAGITPDDLLASYIDVLPFAARLDISHQGTARLSCDPAKPRAKHALNRIDGCDALLAYMETLATRTFVPETAQSRAVGAGAGLSDND